jgi:hypothetical protein
VVKPMKHISGRRSNLCEAEEGNHICNRPDDHSGEHRCNCGEWWDVRSDVY